MLLIPLLLAVQHASPPAARPRSSTATRSSIESPIAGPPSPEEVRYHGCFQLAKADPQQAETRANQWRLDGGGFVAQQCLGVAYANQGKWQAAATEFTGAAQAAQAKQDDRAASYWAEAGNARLAGGDAAGARAALDAALTGTLDDRQRGEALLDRARALVATGDLGEARADLDRAIALVPQDSLAWLLSATLARRTGDLARAHKDIAEAEQRAPNAAPIELEAGNIAAKSGDAETAKAAWKRAVTLAPNSAAGQQAEQALQQFEAPASATP